MQPSPPAYVWFMHHYLTVISTTFLYISSRCVPWGVKVLVMNLSLGSRCWLNPHTDRGILSRLFPHDDHVVDHELKVQALAPPGFNIIDFSVTQVSTQIWNIASAFLQGGISPICSIHNESFYPDWQSDWWPRCRLWYRLGTKFGCDASLPDLCTPSSIFLMQKAEIRTTQ